MLIEDHRVLACLELLALQSGLNVYECIGEPSAFANYYGLIVSGSAGVFLAAFYVRLHVDDLPPRLGALIDNPAMEFAVSRWLHIQIFDRLGGVGLSCGLRFS